MLFSLLGPYVAWAKIFKGPDYPQLVGCFGLYQGYVNLQLHQTYQAGIHICLGGKLFSFYFWLVLPLGITWQFHPAPPPTHQSFFVAKLVNPLSKITKDHESEINNFFLSWFSFGEHLFDHLLWYIFQSSIQKHYKLHFFMI